MLRVLHVTESIAASSGGTSTAFVELIEALRAHASACRVRAIAGPLAPNDPAHAWISHHQPGLWQFTPPDDPPGRLNPRGGGLLRLAHDALREGLDVVHLHGLWLRDLVLIARLARRRGVGVVWQSHGMLVHEALAHSAAKKKLFLALGLRSALRAADAVVFTSDYERDTSRLDLLGDRPRRAVVPLPIDVPPLPAASRAQRDAAGATARAAFGLPTDAPVVLFIGRVHPVKRLELAVDALAHATRALAPRPAPRLLIVGDGEPAYAESIRARAARAGLADQLVFAGWLSGPDKERAFVAADAVLLCSQFENFGYALVEGLARQLPGVVTANLSLAAPMLAQRAGASAPVSTAGPLATEHDARALGEALAGVLALDQNARADMGARARAWVEAAFSRHAVGAALLELYAALRPAHATTTHAPGHAPVSTHAEHAP